MRRSITTVHSTPASSRIATVGVSLSSPGRPLLPGRRPARRTQPSWPSGHLRSPRCRRGRTAIGKKEEASSRGRLLAFGDEPGGKDRGYVVQAGGSGPTCSLRHYKARSVPIDAAIHRLRRNLLCLQDLHSAEQERLSPRMIEDCVRIAGRASNSASLLVDQRAEDLERDRLGELEHGAAVQGVKTRGKGKRPRG